MTNTYITCKQEISENSKTVVMYQQMSDDGKYVIIDPERYIARLIYRRISDDIDFDYDESCIEALIKLQADGTYSLSPRSDKVECEILIIVNKKDNQYGFKFKDTQNSYSANYIYSIDRIRNFDEVYLVVECISNPSDDCNLIVRCDHTYFDSMRGAEKYQNLHHEDYQLSRGDLRYSGYDIFVVSKTEIEDIATRIGYWYSRNIEAIKAINSYGLDVEDFRYMSDIDAINDKITAFAYDELNDDERYIVDDRIYNIMINFISDKEIKTELDNLKNTAKRQNNNIKTVRDKAVILALIHAETDEKFKQVHEALGDMYGWCIGKLTDDIWNKHSHDSDDGELVGDGYILLDKTGNLSWFPDLVCFDDWNQSDDSPYKGKFMPNDADILLCFREYHPEKIADRILSSEEVNCLQAKYANARKAKIAEHKEMSFSYENRRDKNGHPCDVAIVTGKWYPHGINVEDSNCQGYGDTQFPRYYYNYEFTEDECKRLLSGEEIIIKNYITKDDGIRCTIRGRLGDKSTKFDDGPIIEFVRTDIDQKERNAINAKYGII